MWNVGYLPKLYWTAGLIRSKRRAPRPGPAATWVSARNNLEAKAKEIAKIKGYKKSFELAFPARASRPRHHPGHLGLRAHAGLRRHRVRQVREGHKSALSAQQKEGLELFMGKAGCVACHAPPYFSLAYFARKRLLQTSAAASRTRRRKRSRGAADGHQKDSDWAAFKPPTLRNVTRARRTFNDGSEHTLEDAVALHGRRRLQERQT
jgi:cytochrome c peroxidase